MAGSGQAAGRRSIEARNEAREGQSARQRHDEGEPAVGVGKLQSWAARRRGEAGHETGPGDQGQTANMQGRAEREHVAPWQLSLKRSMGSLASAPVVVRELWHARGELNCDDLEGLVSVLPLGGSATLRSGQRSVYIPRSTALSVHGLLLNPMVPAAAAVRWRGTQETRTRTILVMMAGEGRWWRDAPPSRVPEAPDASSSDEGLPEDDQES